jgi:hypothetical protein
MPNKIKPKRSYTTNAVPLTSDLEAHELAINWADGKAYTKDANGQIVSVTLGGGGGGGGMTWASAPASASASGTAGQLAYDADYLYLATATNTWKRTALSSWVVDAYFSSVSLLLHGDGTLADSSSAARTVTAYGSATATGAAKFGSAALSFSGSSSYLRAAASSAYAFPGDFTLETWVFFTSASASFSGFYGAAIMSTYPGGGSPNAGWQWRINGTSSGFDQINLYTGATDLTWSASFNLNQWHHVAISRSGSSIRAFVDGVQQGSTTTNSDNMSPSTNADLWIGRLDLGGYEFQLPGRLDDLRVTKGVARYTANFTPPTAAFPDA